MSYFRRTLGDPITDPSQLDLPPGSLDAGTLTGPQRVPCNELPRDSPFLLPGRVCGPQGDGNFFSTVWDAITKAATPQASVEPSFPWLPVLALAGGAYYLMRSKKRG